MNERINSLAEQADEFADNEIRMPGEYHPDWHNVRDQKFAESIVRECINCCDDIDVIQKHYLKYGINQELGASQCIEVIKKHFGVEE